MATLSQTAHYTRLRIAMQERLAARAALNMAEKEKPVDRGFPFLCLNSPELDQELSQSLIDFGNGYDFLTEHGIITDKALDQVRKNLDVWAWDEEQEAAISAIEAGESICLIGAAGTGKTTIMAEAIKRMQQKHLIPPLTRDTKWLVAGQPGIAVLSFTNKAVANIKKRLPVDIHCITCHKLIEFEPHFYEVQDATGEWYKTMRFEPGRNRFKPLPTSLKIIIIEESGTVSTELFAQLLDALPNPSKVQFVFMGDIQQLAPVYGQAILGFKMLELKTIELTKVHRQADDSPILGLAWKLLEGKPLTIKQVSDEFDTEKKLKIRPWKQKLQSDKACYVATLLLNQFIDGSKEDPMDRFYPEEDMILCPNNKSFGTLELNINIADKLGKKRQAEVHEVIVGWNKKYFAVGDKILVQKQEAMITEIVRNGLYRGKEPNPSSVKLNRWGLYEVDNKEDKESVAEKHLSLEEMEALLLASNSNASEVDDKVNQASHIIKFKMLDSEITGELSTTGELMDLIFAYALTIHKAQGSEWKRVILFLHSSHANMTSRELLYTAITRAKESLYIICEPNTFVKGILYQKIKGNTLAEKAEYFKGKKEKLMENQDPE